MKRILEQKKKYDEIEIPQELSSRVSAAIEQSKNRTKRGFGFYVKVLAAPVAVCAAICIAIGMNGLPDYAPSVENDAEKDVVQAGFGEETPEMANVMHDETMPAATESASMPKTRAIQGDVSSLSVEMEKILPIDEPIMLWFSSGAGAWHTEIVLNPDGTFTGEYSDSDMGVAKEEYPKGTVYICSFSGSFGNVEKKNDYTYTMKLESLEYDSEVRGEYIEDGFRYIKSEPYGLIDGKEFVFYLPNAPASVLTEEERGWWHGRMREPVPETLESYGLVNKNTADGFYS